MRLRIGEIPSFFLDFVLSWVTIRWVLTSQRKHFVWQIDVDHISYIVLFSLFFFISLYSHRSEEFADWNMFMVNGKLDILIQLLLDFLRKLLFHHLMWIMSLNPFTWSNYHCNVPWQMPSMMPIKYHKICFSSNNNNNNENEKPNSNKNRCDFVFLGYSQLKSSFGSATSPCLPGKCVC